MSNPHMFTKISAPNQCYRLYNNNTWFSYTHKKFYCNLPHSDGQINLLECFKTQDQLLAHMKSKHNMEFQNITIPPAVDCMVE